MRHQRNNQPSHWEQLFMQVQKKLHKKRYLIITGALLVLLLIMFFGFFKMVFFLLLLLGLNVFISFVAKHIPRAHTSVELIMFSTVLAGFAYGGRIGALFGAISALLYYYAAGRISFYVTIFAPLYAIIGIVASVLSGFPIFKVGMILTITYTLISSIIVILVFNARIDKAIMFSIVNTAFNFIMFKYFAPIFIALM